MNGSNAWAKRRVYHAGDTKSQAIKEQNSEEWKKKQEIPREYAEMEESENSHGEKNELIKPDKITKRSKITDN